MKQIYFIKWLFNSIVTNIKSWDRWMWGWLITCAWGPTAIMDRVEVPASYNLFVMFVLLFWVVYGLIYTRTKNAYKKFQDEQARIVDHLK
jgi:hypothetical protein